MLYQLPLLTKECEFNDCRGAEGELQSIIWRIAIAFGEAACGWHNSNVKEKLDGRLMVAGAKKSGRIGPTGRYIETYGRTKDTKCLAESDVVYHVEKVSRNIVNMRSSLYQAALR